MILGGLHSEMAMWRMVGDLLETSGWTTVLAEAEVASAGVADSFLKVAHLTQSCRKMHMT